MSTLFKFYVQVWRTWIFLNNIIIYNFIFICMVKEKTMELRFQFLKYPQWILRWLKNFIIWYKCERKKFMIFHEANKLSSNITWVDSTTLNVIPYFQDRSSPGRATCFAQGAYQCWTSIGWLLSIPNWFWYGGFFFLHTVRGTCIGYFKRLSYWYSFQGWFLPGI